MDTHDYMHACTVCPSAPSMTVCRCVVGEFHGAF
jgi:hypothetical protein